MEEETKSPVRNAASDPKNAPPPSNPFSSDTSDLSPSTSKKVDVSDASRCQMVTRTTPTVRTTIPRIFRKEIASPKTKTEMIVMRIKLAAEKMG